MFLPINLQSRFSRVRERAAQWLSWYQGPIGYEVRDLSVTAGDDAAFCHYLYRVTGTMTNGREVDMWVRSTVCFRKDEGEWAVAHEHTSVPFDAESGKASVDLKP
jgi:ketosteroid isomerase-like protein